MESLGEIPESPDLGEQTPTTKTHKSHKSSTTKSSKSKKRQGNKSSSSLPQPRHSTNTDTPTPTSDNRVVEPSSDRDAPESQRATLNGTSSHQDARKHKKKEHRRQKKGQLQTSSEIGGSPELGTNGATVPSALGNASSKKRKNSEMGSNNPKKSKHGHNADATLDAPNTFSSLAETLYKRRKDKGKGRASNQQPALRNSSDSDSDANGVDEDADEDEHPVVDPDGSEGDKDEESGFSPQTTSADNSSVAAPSTPTKRAAGKRVVKRTFFERIAQEEADNKNGQSSSSVAGPSKSSKKRQPKMSAMLQGETEDSQDQNTSSAMPHGAPSTQQHPHKLATGAFSEFELRNITQAVERWRDDHQLTQHQVNDLIQGNPKKVKSTQFWARIVATCPNRKRQKIINQCRRKFHNFVARGSWTTEQNNELKELWDIYGNKYAVIGRIINRLAEDVRDRVRNYAICGNKRRSDPWTKEEENRLESIITEALETIRAQRESADISDDEDDEDLIDWQRVSELMERTRSRLQCMSKWKIMVRQKHASDGSIDGGEVLPVDDIIDKARDEAEAMSNDERYHLVKAIRAYRSQADSRIPWAKVREKKMGKRWTRPTLMLVWYRLKLSVADWNVMSVPEITKQLSKRYHETEELPFPDGEDYDLDAEYTEIKNKVNKILKYQSRRAKVESDDDTRDDDDDDDGGDGDDDGGNDDDGNEANDQHNEGNSEDGKDGGDGESANGQLDADTPMEDEADEADYGSDGSTSNSPADDRSISDLRPSVSRRGQKTYSSRQTKNSSSKEMPSKRTPVKQKAKAVIEDSSEDDEIGDQDEVSSDTNASDASSIPAHL
ncbi:hypothetical protein F4820DRAFT_443611 [Hypoxylon rubiginosum]|uniref:Uncharacterized protein n=1 Tax=Hypoxylon rubiginosum TaxID=110542 RepID=A0ACB9ZF65_9PEZI|nr:hypothetical protein F4820DRAFT_443611 [Hypoxylon rubiginosum]